MLKSTPYTTVTGQHNLRRIYIRKATPKEYNKIGLDPKHLINGIFYNHRPELTDLHYFHYKASGHTFMGTISYYMIIQWDGIRPSIRRWAPGILITRGNVNINYIVLKNLAMY